MQKDSTITWTANLRIEKYNDDDSYKRGIPDEVQHIKGNTATRIGLFALWNLAMGTGTNTASYTYDNTAYTVTGFYPLDNTNAYIGVGSGSGDNLPPVDMADTGLKTPLAYVKADTNYPQTDSANPNTLKVQVTFGANTATGAWREWGVFNGDPSSNPPAAGRSAMNTVSENHVSGNIVMFNHKAEDMGTKSANATWVIIGDFVLSPVQA